MTEQQERALSHDGAAMSRSSTEGGEREHVKSVEDEEGTPDRALYDAIIEDDLEAVKRALAIGGNPNR
jgi:hypothetical protein